MTRIVIYGPDSGWIQSVQEVLDRLPATNISVLETDVIGDIAAHEADVIVAPFSFLGPHLFADMGNLERGLTGRLILCDAPSDPYIHLQLIELGVAGFTVEGEGLERLVAVIDCAIDGVLLLSASTRLGLNQIAGHLLPTQHTEIDYQT